MRIVIVDLLVDIFGLCVLVLLLEFWIYVS